MRRFVYPVLMILLALGSTQGLAQDRPAQGQAAARPIAVFTVAPSRPPGIPTGYTPPARAAGVEKGSRPQGQPLPKEWQEWMDRRDPDRAVRDGAPIAAGTARLGAVQAAQVQRAFVANHLGPSNPMDNSMAISDSGYIVSADNYTIDFYKDGPDTLVQFQSHSDFYEDTTIGIRGFDPKVIYDRWHRKFILVLLLDQNNRDNKMLLSFSKHEDPRRGWNHYRLNTDTLSADQWFDFPMIALNHDELFIAGNMADDAADEVVGNKIYQIRLQEGYDSLTLRCRIWPDVLDTDGAMASFLCPLGHALQDSAYNQGMHFVSTKYIYSLPIQLDSSLFRYRITDNLSNPQATMLSWKTTTVPYNKPNDGLQLNGTDPIQVGDCRILSGFFLNDKLYFVYVYSSSGYAVIALTIWDINSNSLQRHPWGFPSAQYHYCYPSIAFYGADTQDENQIIMCFQRTGASIYPQVLAVHFDSGFVNNSIVVQQGLGEVSITGTGSAERWGDYTSIQRRYGQAYPACWLVGSYAAGASPNSFGFSNGLNAFIAEISDTVLTSASKPNSVENIEAYIFPNPSIDGVFSVMFSSKASPVRRWKLIDAFGRVLVSVERESRELFQVDLTAYPIGAYFLIMETQDHNHESYLLIRN